MYRLNPKRNKPNLLRRAFTLTEVLVAASVLSIAGFGTLSGLMQARKMTEGSIYVATATTVAQGYIEQIKNMDFGLLDIAAGSSIPELMSQGIPDTLTVSTLPADPEVGAGSDIVNSRFIDINNTPDFAGDDLELEFVVYVQDITDYANGIGEAKRIILRWGYIDNTRGTSFAVGNTLYAIRSKVPTY